MTRDELNGGLDRINAAYGCLAMGHPSCYDGADCATTLTIFVAHTEAAYATLRAQGARPISTAEAGATWLRPVEGHMTQFEFHA